MAEWGEDGCPMMDVDMTASRCRKPPLFLRGNFKAGMTEKGRIIWKMTMRKSPLAPLCQSGE
jgi:hypothetical protein